MHTQVRKRTGFKTSADELPGDGARVLDEQGTADLWCTLNLTADSCFGDLEQDEVIGDICHQMVKSGREHQVGVGIIALLSCVL